MTNREAFVTALATLAATYDKKLTPEAVEGYWLALNELTEREFAAATVQALRHCEFMPVPARLLAYAREARNSYALFAYTEQRSKELREWQQRGNAKELEAIRETVAELADAKDANRPHVLQREPLVVTEDEKRETLERAAALLAARRTS